MTTKPAGRDMWFCKEYLMHQWMYRGKDHGYRCTLCGLQVTKLELKAATDA